MSRHQHNTAQNGPDKCRCFHDDTKMIPSDTKITFQNEKGKVIVQPPAGVENLFSKKKHKKEKKNMTWSHDVQGYVGCQDLDTIMEHINSIPSTSNPKKKQAKNKKKSKKIEIKI